MSVIIFAETWEGKFKKATFEAVSYGARVAASLGTETIALTIGNLNDDAVVLGKYGASKTITVQGDYANFSNATYANIINQVAAQQGATMIIVSGTSNGKSLAPALSVNFDAALITNATALPESTSALSVQRSVFSSKGLALFQSESAKTVITIVPNAIGVAEVVGAGAVESAQVNTDGNIRAFAIDKIDRVSGKIPLPEAELVVSAGRGMKAPENWNIIEELATELGAATACSKPVSDIGWRPHSEHVGQTGIQINPNLYIAVGISGAIQHLAGVSASKKIVVINTDPEAPFFKAADYGIVGDAFDVVPKLTAAIKAYKANN
jgi:electron transfer flavoprotein alpha subunit